MQIIRNVALVFDITAVTVLKSLV